MDTSEPVRVIDDFRGDYRWLSNFHLCRIVYEGIVYPSTEHAYQAAKDTDESVRRWIAQAPTCREAKTMGGRNGLVNLRPDWEQVKNQVMMDVCWIKFTVHADLREKLLATGDALLIEGNSWGDEYWGCVRRNGVWVGRNQLGKTLMSIRRFIRG